MLTCGKIGKSLKIVAVKSHRAVLRCARRCYIKIKKLFNKHKRNFFYQASLLIYFLKKKARIIRSKYRIHKDRQVRDSVAFIKSYSWEIRKEYLRKVKKESQKELLEKESLAYRVLNKIFVLARIQLSRGQRVLVFILAKISLSLSILINFLVSIKKGLVRIILKKLYQTWPEINDFILSFKKLFNKHKRNFFYQASLSIYFLKKKARVIRSKYRIYKDRPGWDSAAFIRAYSRETRKEYLKEIKRESQKEFLQKGKPVHELLSNFFNEVSLPLRGFKARLLKTFYSISWYQQKLKTSIADKIQGVCVSTIKRVYRLKERQVISIRRATALLVNAVLITAFLTPILYFGLYLQKVKADQGIYSPSANAVAVNGFTNPADAYSSNDIRATEGTADDSHDYYDYDILLSGYIIDKVEVGYEACGGEKLGIQVSWDGGVGSWSTEQVTSPGALASCGSETVVYWDFTSATAWTSTKLNNANFKVRVRHVQQGGPGTNEYDWIPARITYTVVTTTMGDGTDPDDSTIAPGVSILDIDAFTIETNIGTDSIIAATATLATGLSAVISEIRITSDDGATPYFNAVSDPSSDVIGFTGGTSIPVSTTSAQFKIRITPKTHTNMPAPPGSSYTATATITAWDSTNNQVGSDTDSATIIIDNQSPGNVTGASGSAGDAQVSLSWTNPADSDLDSIIVLMATSTVIDTPDEGITYSKGNAIGTSTVVCVATSTETSCDDTGLTNGTAYYYEIFALDSRGNYATGTVPSSSPFTPQLTPETTIGDGIDPGESTIAPGVSILDIDSFTFQTNTGADSIIAATATLATGLSAAISEIRITSDDGATPYFSAVSDPSSDIIGFSGGTPIPVSTTSVQFKIRIKPKTHANMPAPPGSSYTATATITAWDSNNNQAGSDTDSATIMIDNQSPGNVIGASGSAGDAQVSLSWTNPADSDLDSIIVLMATSTVIDTPTEGITYSKGNAIGTSTVVCVATSTETSCADTGLINGTAYYYEIFALDSRGNYATGTVPSGLPFTPQSIQATIGNGIDPGDSTIAPGASILDIDAFTIETNTGTDNITAATATLSTGLSGVISEIRITSDDGATLYFNAVSDPASDIIGFSGGTSIPVSTTSVQFKIRIKPKTHANMPAPPGSTYTATATITAWDSNNNQAGSDTDSATIIIDNQSPGNVIGASGSAGDAQASLSWTNPGDGDLDSIIVLMATSTVIDTPTEGITYSKGNAIGTSTVVCVATSTQTSCADTGLTNGTDYYYEIFALDSRGNYATGTVPSGLPFTPITTVTLGDGIDPSDSTIAPGASILDIDSFTFQTGSGADSITAATATLATGLSGAISEIRITSDDGATLYFNAVSDPSSDIIGFSGGTPIPVSTTSVQFKIRIKPKTHANMPAPPGSTYTATATITAWDSTNNQTGSDTGSATIIIDNQSPGNVIGASGSAGDAQVSLSWTNPGDGDLDSIIVLMATSTVIDTPTEGITYSKGNAIGTSTVVCVATSTQTSCDDTGLDNGTDYYYEIFALDSRGNYATGTVPSSSPFTPVTTVTLGDGIDPSDSTIAPGASILDIDSFTFQTGTGADSIMAATATLATGLSGAISEIRITSDDGATPYFSAVSDPSSDIIGFTGGTPIPVSTTSVQFKIRITPKTHTNMPAVPGSTYTATATITAWASTNNQTGSDTGSATITIDNQSPGNVIGASGSAGDAQVSLSWTNPGDGDLDSIIVLMATSTVIDTPTEGDTYSKGNAIGTSTVVCVATSTETSCDDTGLTNGTAYYYEIFALDSRGNYATGTVPSGSPVTPVTTVTLGNGINPDDSTIAPSSSITDIDVFTFQTGTGADSITAATATLATGVSDGISEIRITSNNGSILYFNAVSNPSSDVIGFTDGTPIPVSTGLTQFKIRIKSKTHANMPAVPGSTYTATATITAWTSANNQAGSDTDSATITIDNQSPGNVIGASGSAGDTQVSLSWTNPADSDLDSIIVLRSTSAVYQTPTEGDTYNVNDNIGTSTVVCVATSTETSCDDTGLTNGTAYYYEIFALDSRGNYATGTVPSGSPFTPQTTLTIDITSGSKITGLDSGETSQYINDTTCTDSTTCAAFTLTISSGSETVNSIKVTETGTINANNDLSNLSLFYDTDGNFANGVTGQYGSTVANFAADQTATVNGSLVISAGTTYYFYVRLNTINGTNYPLGGQTINFQIASTSDVNIAGTPNKTGTPATLTGTTSVRPNVTSVVYPISPDGGRNGDTFTINGVGLATSCAAVLVQIQTTDLTCNSAATSSLSVTIPVAQTGTHGGTGSNGLLVTVGGTADNARQDFFVYPDITSLTTPLAVDAAREYASGDSDGIITINGNRFAGSAGSVTVLGESATVNSWNGTAITIRIPASISDTAYTGDIIIARAADGKTASQTSFRILPRITSLSPASGESGETIQILGNHFCQSGTCPAAGDRSTSTDNVQFYNAVQVGDADVTAWSDTQASVRIPTNAATGNITVKSNNYNSNGVQFTLSTAEPEEPEPASSGSVFFPPPASAPLLAPTAGPAQALSSSAIRWYFTDNSSNETGFELHTNENGYYEKILSLASPNLSFLDETGLSVNTQYAHRYIRAIIGSSYSGFSGELPAVYTLIQDPVTLEMVQKTSTSITVKVKETLSNLGSGNSGLFFENVTMGTDSGWIQVDSWTAGNLVPASTYGFRAKARNADQIESSFSSLYSFITEKEEIIPRVLEEISPVPPPIEEVPTEIPVETPAEPMPEEEIEEVVAPEAPEEPEKIAPEIPEEEAVPQPSMVTKSWQTTKDTFGAVKDEIVKTGQGVGFLAKKASQNISQTTKNTFGAVKDEIVKTGQVVGSLAKKASQNISQTTKNTFGAVKTGVVKTGQGVGFLAKKASQNIFQTTENTFGAVKDEIVKTRQGIGFLVKKIAQNIYGVLKNIASRSSRLALLIYDKIMPGKQRLPDKKQPLVAEREYISPQPTLSPENIPLDTIVAKSEVGDISLPLTPAGELNLLAGTSFTAFIKPSKPITSITAKLFLETTAVDVPSAKSFFFPGYMAHAAGEAYARVSLVQEYVFQDPDQDGIYTASITVPPVPGNYTLTTSFDYTDGGHKEIKTPALVDPRGYVYRLERDGLKARIIKATVTLYYYNPDTGQYQSWAASAYDQKNPQITDDTGEYAFFVPTGKYYLTVTADNYASYQSEKFKVKEGMFIHSNIELKYQGGFWQAIF